MKLSIASVVLFIALLFHSVTFGQVIIPVPFISQGLAGCSNSQTTNFGTSFCGHTCSEMIMGYFDPHSLSTANIQNYNTLIENQYHGGTHVTCGTGTPDPNHLIWLFNQYGYVAKWYGTSSAPSYGNKSGTKSTLQDLLDELNDGKIPMFQCGLGVGNTTTINNNSQAHWMLLKGYDSNTQEIIVNDPGKSAGFSRRYSKTSFESSWASSFKICLVVTPNTPLNQSLPIYGGKVSNPKSLDIYFDEASFSTNFQISQVSNLKIRNGNTAYNIPTNRITGTHQENIGTKFWRHFTVALQAGDIAGLQDNYDMRTISFDLNDNGTIIKYRNSLLYFSDFYNNNTTFSDINNLNLWAEAYIRKGAYLGLFRGTSMATFNPSGPLKREQAAKVLIGTAVRLGLCNVDTSTTSGSFADVDQESEYFPYIQTMRNYGYCALNGNFNPSNTVNIGEFCRFLELVFNIQPSDYAPTNYYINVQHKIIPSYPTNPILDSAMHHILRLVDIREETVGFWRTENLWDFHDFSTRNSPITTPITVVGTTPISRAIMAKVLTNIAIYKANKLGVPLQRVAMTAPDINDMVALGEKYDNSTTPTGSAPTSVQQSYNVASGGSITLQYNSDYDTQGNPMHFYWSMEKNGATLVSNTATHRSVTFTAPTVTSPTDWKLYAYNANNRGKSNEVLITIHVGGTQGSNNAPPSQQAHSLNVGGATTTSLTASWTRGNGQFCMVTCTDDNYNPNQPVNGITYIGNSNYNSAPLTDPGDDSRVVYAGTGNSVTVTGLQSNHSYRFNLYEYNIATGNYALYNYWSVPSVAGSTLGNTPPPVSDFNYPYTITEGQTVTFSSISQNYTSLTWTAGNGSSISGSNSSANCDIYFPSAGSYQIDLLAYSSTTGFQDIETKIIYVSPQTSVTADLFVQAMSVSTPQYVSGQPLTISCSVNNGGIGSYVSATISYFLSSDSILDELTDWAMGQESYNVAAGQAVFVTHLANNIQNNLSGQYYVLTKADYVFQIPNGYIGESNENNNIGIYPLMIVQALPDFVALSVSVTPTTVASGVAFSVTGTFQNIGLGDACGSCPPPIAGLWVSSDNQISQDDIWLSYSLFPGGNISCGGCPSETATNNNVKLPWTLPDGNYYLIAAIDFSFGGIGYGYNVNSEPSESNNWVATPITVLSPNQPTINASNLAITNIDSTTMRVSWNRGNGAGCIVLASSDVIYSAPGLTRDGFQYIPSSDFSSANGVMSLGCCMDNYSKVVYDGSGTFVDVTGLNSAETYSFYVLEYNGAGASRDYFQVTPYAISAHTLAPNPIGGWKQILGHNASSSFVNEVHFFDINNGFIIKKSKPQFGLTTDGGISWKIRDAFPNSYTSLFPQSIVWIGNIGWELEGSGGMVHKTTDGGLTWTHPTNGFNRYGNDIMFRTTNEGYMACGSTGGTYDDDGAILKTSDSGETWSQLKTFGSAMHSVFFIDSQTGWATSHDLNLLLIFRTTDAGVTWVSTPIDRQNVGNSWRIKELYFQTNQIGYAATSTNYLLKTTNGGVSWSIVHQAPPTQSGGESTVEIEFLNSSVGFVKWGNNYLSRTDDGGMTWITGDRIQTFDYNATIGGLSIIDANTMFVCGMGGLYKTTTSGSSNAIDLQSAQSSYCAGSPIDVPYAITGTFDVSNIFTVQLSDNLGSFASPSDLQTFSNVGNGTLSAVLPNTIQGGSSYRIRVTASNPAIVSDTTSAFTVLASPTVSVAVAADSLVICENENATFTASPTNGGTAPTYVWKLNGSIVGSNSNQYSNSSLQDGDVVWVEMASNAACANTTPVVSTPLEIEVTTVDVPFIQAIDSLLAASTDVGVQWYLNGQPISGATSQFYTASQSGFYQVRVTIDGCTAVSALFSYSHIPTTSDPEQEELQDVVVFPNPTSGGFTIKIGSKPLVGARVSVYNALQVKIHDAPLVNNVAEIDLGDQPSGAYFVRIETRKGQVSKVVVKQ